jgi:hypothetical protein
LGASVILATTVTLWFGGQGSGCRGPNCGRPAATVKNHNEMYSRVPMGALGYRPLLVSGKTGKMVGGKEHAELMEKLGYNINKDGARFYQDGGVRVLLWKDRVALQLAHVGSIRLAQDILNKVPVDHAFVEYYRPVGKKFALHEFEGKPIAVAGQLANAENTKPISWTKDRPAVFGG